MAALASCTNGVTRALHVGEGQPGFRGDCPSKCPNSRASFACGVDHREAASRETVQVTSGSCRICQGKRVICLNSSAGNSFIHTLLALLLELELKLEFPPLEPDTTKLGTSLLL